MKKVLKGMFFLLLPPVIHLNILNAQDGKQETSIQNLLDSRQFVFKAETALPVRGGAKYLTSQYDVSVSKTVL